MSKSLQGAIVCNKVDDLCKTGLLLAQMGVGISTMKGLAVEGSKARCVVVLICGPIPEDLVQAFGNYVQSLQQDIKTTHGITTIYEEES